MIVAGMQVTGEDLETVLLACWFHDVGFLVASESHEERSVETARAFLGAQGVDGRKIDVVAACILATRMPQKPVGLLEEIICDADLSHLGGDNFLARNMLLRQEREWREGRTFTDREWLLVNQEFFDGHRYFTAAAHRLFDNGKKRNLARLAELLRGNCK
ncbi:MAG: HD domain-containing protein [Deltaproteobacteria bacterium]|nr:HD domain-containing protein [Candidatus Anaeroferrophillacea bacterium]